MDSRDAEIRVGLAVILALSILVIGIIGAKSLLCQQIGLALILCSQIAPK